MHSNDPFPPEPTRPADAFPPGAEATTGNEGTPGVFPEGFPLDAEEARCLGCLVEKAMTTPDHYPMSLNGVRVACNQVSNRDPIVDYDESTVERALRRLADKGLVRFVHRSGDRVVKYKHAIDERLELDPPATALTAVLLLRGTQTPGELRQRTGRYVDFSSLPEVETTLDSLCGRGLLARIDRRPGQKENRYAELLTGDDPDGAASAASPGYDGPPDAVPSPSTTTTAATATSATIASLEAELATLRSRFETLLDSLGVDDI